MLKMACEISICWYNSFDDDEYPERPTVTDNEQIKTIYWEQFSLYDLCDCPNNQDRWIDFC